MLQRSALLCLGGDAVQEAEQLSALIADIYDAALNPALWASVLGNCTRFVRGAAAGLYAKDAVNRSGNLFYDDGGIAPYWSQLYFDNYIKFDPSTVVHYFSEIEQPVSTVDVAPYSEFTDTKFFREWALPQGLVDHVSAALDKSATSVAMFGVFRHERDGLVDDEMRRRMRLIIPHIRRSVLIGKVMDLKVAEAATLADTLDGLSASLLLVDGHCRVVHANAAGHVLLAEGSVLSAPGRKLSASDAIAEQALHEAILRAGNGDAAVGAKGIAVPITSRKGEHYVAHVLPLTSGVRRRAGATYAAVAALFVRKAALNTTSPPEVIAKTFKLTPSELRVLLAIVEVGGVAETAEALGLAETTVKTHLRRLYAKTDTGRQAELVKLVAAFSSPLTD
jgi:DNA-binding CsgD family transcriptional regulator